MHALVSRVQVFPCTEPLQLLRNRREVVIAGDNGRKNRAMCELCEAVNGLCGMTNKVVLRCKFR